MATGRNEDAVWLYDLQVTRGSKVWRWWEALGVAVVSKVWR
jgi:hypothetical protein